MTDSTRATEAMYPPHDCGEILHHHFHNQDDAQWTTCGTCGRIVAFRWKNQADAVAQAVTARDDWCDTAGRYAADARSLRQSVNEQAEEIARLKAERRELEHAVQRLRPIVEQGAEAAVQAAGAAERERCARIAEEFCLTNCARMDVPPLGGAGPFIIHSLGCDEGRLAAALRAAGAEAPQ